MFTFQPLLGAQTGTTASQSILELDGGVKVLVDVGWDDNFDVHQLVELEKHISTLSFILLTHATQSHLGAFAHCCKHFPAFTQIPVYATHPVIDFGRTLLHDLYHSTPLAATFVPVRGTQSDTASSLPKDATKSSIFLQAPTAEEIAKYFSLITPLKYSQPLQPTASPFSPSLEGLSLTAFNSGHTLGGTIWHIQHGMESIVYAVDWNQARENVIGGAAWFGGIGGAEVIEQLRKPTALICSSKGGDKIALTGGRKKRDDALLDHIRSSLAKGGTVLIPSDSSARVLELAYVLEKAWQESDDQLLESAKVYLASKSAVATVKHARSLLEWMDDSISRDFEGEEDTATKTHKRTGSRQTNGQAANKAGRPFEFKNVKLVERQTQFERMLKAQGPRVIMASDLSLEWGFSKSVLREVCQKAENLVVLTDRLEPAQNDKKNGLGQTLWQWFEERRDGVALETSKSGENLEQIHTGGRDLEIQDIQRKQLAAEEEQIYQQYIATQRQLQTSLQTRSDTIAAVEDDVGDDASSSSSEDSDDEHQGRTLNVSAALGHAGRSKAGLDDKDLGVNVLLRRKGVYDFDVRGKKGRNAVFPYIQSKKRGDEFGEYIKPEEYLRAEEKEDVDQSGNVPEPRLGQKRQWDDETKGRGRPKRQVRSGRELAEEGHIIDDDRAPDVESESSDEEVDTKEIQGPSKALFSTSTVSFSARLAFVDFAGIHDQRSLQMLIPLISPRKLILIGGTEVETKSLARDCQSLLTVKDHDTGEAAAVDILTPLVGQTVDASVDTNAWIVKLSRELVKRLHWQNVRNMGIVTLTGQLKGEEPVVEDVTASKAKKSKVVKEEPETEAPANENKEAQEVSPILDIVPSNVAASTRLAAQPVHVGDLRLADLRRLMQSAGHTAEFRGEGTLVIDGFIAVRKLGTGKVVVEGAPLTAADSMSPQGSIFYQVKRKIYEGLAVVTGA